MANDSIKIQQTVDIELTAGKVTTKGIEEVKRLFKNVVDSVSKDEFLAQPKVLIEPTVKEDLTAFKQLKFDDLLGKLQDTANHPNFSKNTLEAQKQLTSLINLMQSFKATAANPAGGTIFEALSKSLENPQTIRRYGNAIRTEVTQLKKLIAETDQIINTRQVKVSGTAPRVFESGRGGGEISQDRESVKQHAQKNPSAYKVPGKAVEKKVQKTPEGNYEEVVTKVVHKLPSSLVETNGVVPPETGKKEVKKLQNDIDQTKLTAWHQAQERLAKMQEQFNTYGYSEQGLRGLSDSEFAKLRRGAANLKPSLGKLDEKLLDSDLLDKLNKHIEYISKIPEKFKVEADRRAGLRGVASAFDTQEAEAVKVEFTEGRKAKKKAQEAIDRQESEAVKVEFTEGRKAKKKVQEAIDRQESEAVKVEFTEGRKAKKKAQEAIDRQEAEAVKVEFTEGRKAKKKAQEAIDRQESEAVKVEFTEGRKTKKKVQEAIDRQEAEAVKVEFTEGRKTKKKVQEAIDRQEAEAVKVEFTEGRKAKKKAQEAIDRQEAEAQRQLIRESSVLYQRTVFTQQRAAEGDALHQAGIDHTNSTPHQKETLKAFHNHEIFSLSQGEFTEAKAHEISKHAEAIRNLNAAAKESSVLETLTKRATHLLTTFANYGIAYAGLYKLVDGIKDLVGASIELEDNLKNIQAVTSATENEMVTVGEAIKTTASTTAFSVDEISKAVMVVAQAGTAIKDIPKTVQAVADVATATGSNLAAVADIITTAQQVWDKVDVETIGNRIAQASNVSKMAVEDLRTILSLEGSAANTANISLDQNLAMLATLRNAGVRPSTIATGATQMTRELFSPDDKFSAFLSHQYEKMGEKVSKEQAAKTFSDFKLTDNPILGAVTELKRIGVNTFEGMTKLERVMDSRALNVFKPLLENSQELAGMEAKIAAGATAAESAATASETLKKSLGNLKDQVELTADSFIEDLLPGLRNFTDWAKDGFKTLEDNHRKAKYTREAQGVSVAEQVGSNLVQFPKTVAGGVVDFAKGAYDIATGNNREFLDSARGVARGVVNEILATFPTGDMKLSEKHKEPSEGENAVDPRGLAKSVLEQVEAKKSEVTRELNNYSQYLPTKSYQDKSDQTLVGKFQNADTKYADSFKQLAAFTKGEIKPDDYEKQGRILSLLSKAQESAIGGAEGKSQWESTVRAITKEAGGSRELTKDELSQMFSSLLGSEATLKEQFQSLMIKNGELNRKNPEDLNPAEQDLKGILTSLAQGGDKAISAFTSNITPEFKDLHDFLEKFYREMALKADEAHHKFESVLEASYVALVKSAIEKSGKGSESDAARSSLRTELESQVRDNPQKVEVLRNSAFNQIDASSASAADKDNLKQFVGNNLDSTKDALAKKYGKNLANLLQQDMSSRDILLRKVDRTPQEEQSLQSVNSRIGWINQSLPDYGVGQATTLPSQRYFDKQGNVKVTDKMDKYHDLFLAAGEKYHIDPLLLQANSYKESSGDPNNVSSADAVGVSQLTSATARWLGLRVDDKVDERRIPEKAIPAMAKYLAHIRDLPYINGDERKMLIGYNMGPNSESGILHALAQGSGESFNHQKDVLAFRDATKAAQLKKVDTTKLKEHVSSAEFAKIQQVHEQALAAGYITNQGEAGTTSSHDHGVAKQAYQIEPERVHQQYVPDEALLKERDAAHKRLQVAQRENKEDIRPALEAVTHADLALKQHELDFSQTNYYTPEQDKAKVKDKAIAKLNEELRQIKEAGIEALAEDFFTSSKELADLAVKAAQDRVTALKEKIGRDKETGDSAAVSEHSKELKEATDYLFAKQVAAEGKNLRASSKEVATAALQNLSVAHSKALDDITNTTVDSRIGARQKELSVFDNQPASGGTARDFFKQGYQKETGQSVSLDDQRAAATNEAAILNKQANELAQDFANLSPKTQGYEQNLEKLTENAATLAERFGKLKATVEDLAPSLASEFGQISVKDIQAKINDLGGSLSHLNENITQHIVNAADQISTDVGSTAVTQIKKLLGYNVTPPDMINTQMALGQQQGNLALVQTNKAQLASYIQSVQMNETDPTRQKILIQQAQSAQSQAEAIAAQQVNEAQKQADKAAYDNSLQGKMGNALSDMAGGVVQDAIKGEMLSAFSDLLGTNALGSAESKPMYVQVTNLPKGSTDTSTGSSTSSSTPGFFDKIGNTFSSWFGSDTPNTDTTQQASSPSGTQAEGAGVVSQSVATGAETGILSGMESTWGTAKETFSGFTDAMGGKFDGFLAALGGMMGLAAGTKQKMSTLDKVQMGLGIASSVLGLAGGIGKMFSGASSLGGTGAGSFQNLTNSSGGGFFSGLASSADTKLAASIGSALPKFATGGYITGPGTGTSDSIPAKLSNGEYVLNADAVSKIGKDTLDAWNFSNRTPVARATGGVADPLNYASRNVTPASQTPQAQATPASDTNIRVVMVDDQRNVANYINSSAGEKVLVDFVKRNSMTIKSLVK